jgi:hypothetical protein
VIYRGLTPYLLGDSLASTTGTTYIDVGATGDTASNFFYMVKAVDPAGRKSEESNQVGEFGKSLPNVK